MNKTERAQILEMLDHAERNIAFGGAGTYSLHDYENTPDTKAIARAKIAVENVRWIVTEGSF